MFLERMDLKSMKNDYGLDQAQKQRMKWAKAQTKDEMVPKPWLKGNDKVGQVPQTLHDQIKMT